MSRQEIDEESMAEVRAYNARSWSRINSASEEPPILFCEICAKEECLCDDSKWDVE